MTTIEKIQELLPGYEIEIRNYGDNVSWLIASTEKGYAFSIIENKPSDEEIKKATQRVKNAINGKESEFYSGFKDNARKFLDVVLEASRSNK
jgi:hypothetical protein